MPGSSAVDQPMLVPRVFGKIHPFWALQIFDWSAYFLVHMVVLAEEGGLDARTLYGYVTATVAGFSVTLLMRVLYRRWSQTTLGFGWIVVLLLGSLLGANAIMIVADLPKLLVSPAADVFRAPELMPYLQRLYWWILYCGAWSVLYLGFQFWKTWKLRELETERALAAAQAAKIQMLRYRLNPDLLFSALAAIRDLTRSDTRRARLAVTDLPEYLRYNLVNRGQPEVPACEEMEAARRFLAVRGMMIGTRKNSRIS